jgi:hypothetical protein
MTVLSCTSRASEKRQLIEDGLRWRAQQESLAEERAAAEAEVENQLHHRLMEEFMACRFTTFKIYLRAIIDRLAVPIDEPPIVLDPTVKHETVEGDIVINPFSTPERIVPILAEQTTPPESGAECSPEPNKSIIRGHTEERNTRQGKVVFTQTASPPDSERESGKRLSAMVKKLESSFIDGPSQGDREITVRKRGLADCTSARHDLPMNLTKPVHDYPPILPPPSLVKKRETQIRRTDCTTPVCSGCKPIVLQSDFIGQELYLGTPSIQTELLQYTAAKESLSRPSESISKFNVSHLNYHILK